MASATSWLIGSASQVRIGASDGSVICARPRKGRHERQLRCSLPCDGHGDLRTEARRISAKCAERLADGPVRRNDDVHQEVPAVGRRRNVLDEQIVQAIVGMPIRQREIQRTLNLPAELPRLSFTLPA